MHLLVDFFPLLLFFIAFKVTDIFIATGVAIVASVVQIAWLHWRGRPIKPINWFGLGVIVVFGGTTLLLHDEFYIKLKMTVYYWLCALLLLIGHLGWRKNFVEALLPKEEISLPGAVWTQLLWAWIGFCAMMGALNLYVAMTYPLSTWVNFKVFGGTALLFVFALAQGIMIARHLPQDSQRP